MRTATLCVLVLAALAAPARADIQQPNGTTIPTPAIGCYGGKPGGLGAIFACVCTKPGACNIGAACPGGSTSCDPGTNSTCETTIWHEVNDDPCIPKKLSGLDPVKDAAVKPETYRPVCGLTFELVARGAAMFKNAFGWYNVDPGGKKPNPGDLHLLIDCNATSGTSAPLNLLSQPAYNGGDVGFFIVTPESQTQKGTCAGGDCCATVARAAAGNGYVYYSQPQFNPDNAGASSYIHLLIYNSRIASYKYYFAWEDTYNGTSNDFGDFVTAVSGISCSGGGLRCDTGKLGVCGMGISKCGPDGKVACEGTYQGSAEVCDGLDNDCDGEIDEDATCPSGQKCYQGVCVGNCQTSSEFACQIGFECDAQLGKCVDTTCKGKLCKAGEICRGGVCANGCDGVVCPKDQICLVGACVDPCKGRSCNNGEICKLGVCLPNCVGCGGLTCTNGLACDTASGDCYDPSCTPACAADKICNKGKCVDLCDGVVCPGGVTCAAGVCPPSGIGKPKPKTDGGAPPVRDSGGPAPDTKKTDGFSGDSGCSCELAAAPRTALALLWPLLVLFALARRRR